MDTDDIALSALGMEKINWDMQATCYGEPCTPFSAHVRPAPTPHAASEFLPFLRLPTELQLHILDFCDSATLFQLMQVCCMTRQEAGKLFWSQPNAWYLISGAWLLNGRGLTGHTHNAIDALSFMQRVEVYFCTADPFRKVRGEDDIGVTRRTKIPYASEPHTTQDRMRDIQDFWKTLQRQLPRATQVIISGFPTPLNKPSPAIWRIAAECPPGISVHVSLLREGRYNAIGEKRSLWQPIRCDGSTSWERTQPTWTRTRKAIIPPPKTFRGPVGAYCYLRYYRKKISRINFARRLFAYQAVEDHYTRNRCASFTCPARQCELQFESPGVWNIHAFRAEHTCFEIDLPSERLQTIFAPHNDRFTRMLQEAKSMLGSMWVAWGDEGSHQRSEAIKAFQDQLEHDPLYTQEKPVTESRIWKGYEREMQFNSTISRG